MNKRYVVINTDAGMTHNRLLDDGSVAVPSADGPFVSYDKAKEHAKSPWRKVVAVAVDEDK